MSDLAATLISRLNKNLNTLDSSAANLAVWIRQSGSEANTAEIRKQLEALAETTDTIAELLAEIVAEKD